MKTLVTLDQMIKMHELLETIAGKLVFIEV